MHTGCPVAAHRRHPMSFRVERIRVAFVFRPTVTREESVPLRTRALLGDAVEYKDEEALRRVRDAEQIGEFKSGVCNRTKPKRPR